MSLTRPRPTLPPAVLPESYLLTPEHRQFRLEVQEFLAREAAPIAEEHEAAQRFPRELLGKMGQAGLLGAPFSPAYGGQGRDSLCGALLVEEASRVWGSLGIILAAHLGLGIAPIDRWGTEAQKQRYLPGLIRGETLGGYGLTEPQAGSDSGATRTTARLEGDEWVLNGTKVWCTNATEALSYVVSAVTDPEAGKRGISAFLIERGTPGFSFGKKEDKLGLRASATGTLIMEECRIPASQILGRRGEGFKYFMQTLDGGRISIGAMALGLGLGAMDEVVRSLAARDLEGDLFDHEYALAPLAEMGAELTAARSLVYNAALEKDRGARWTLDGAMAKWFASEAAMRVTSRALEILGPEALRPESPAARAFRDAKLCTIGEGTNEIQRVVIAREMLQRYRSE